MASKYYTPPPQVIDGDIAYAADVNDINDETDAAFVQVEADIILATEEASGWADKAKEWAEGPGEPPDPNVEVEPGLYSSHKYANDSSASASASATSAGESLVAKDAAVVAQGAAETAQGHAETAQGAAETAQGLAETAQGLAEVARDKAEDWAQEAEDVPVEPGLYSSYHWAKKAEADAAVSVLSVTGTGVDNTDPRNPVVTITPSVIGLGNVDNTSDANKPISTAQDAGLVSQTSETGAAEMPVGTVAQRPTGAKGLLRFNDDEDTFEGHDGVEWGPIGGGGGLDWSDPVKTTDFVAEAGKGYMIDTTSQIVTMTLPAGVDGESVAYKDYANNFDHAHLVISPDGTDKIEGVSGDTIEDGRGAGSSLAFKDATKGWLVVDHTPIDLEDKTPRNNIVINGCGRINQRGSIQAGGFFSGDYVVDRMVCSYAGASSNTFRIGESSTESFRFYGMKTTTFTKTGTNFIFPIGHRIEGNNVQDLVHGGSLTVSFKARSTVTGIYCARIILRNSADVDRAIVKTWSMDADTWTDVSFTIDIPDGYLGSEGNDEAVYISIGNTTGPDREGPADTWSTDVSIATVAGHADWASNGTKDFLLAELKAEVGSVATPFELTDVGEELAKCQRYYFKTYNQGTKIGAVTEVGAVNWRNEGAASRTATHKDVAFPTTMRTSPVIVTYSTATGASGYIRNTTTNTDVSTVSVPAGERGTRDLNVSVAVAAGATIKWQFSADAEL